MRRILPLGLGLVLTAAAFSQVVELPAVPPLPPPAQPGPPAVPPADPDPDVTLLRRHKVAAGAAGAMAFLKSRFSAPVTDEGIVALVAKMGDESFFVRQAASRDLALAGVRAKKRLADALKHADLEIAYRAADVIQRIDRDGVSAQVAAAAVRVLARGKADSAVEFLLEHAPALEADGVGGPVRAALASLGRSGDGLHPALASALADASPVRRAAAGVAAARIGPKDKADDAALLKLLDDPDREVHLPVALELAARKRGEAVRVLVEQTGRFDDARALAAEDALLRLAREKAPRAESDDEADVKKYRQAWRDWWKAERGKVDLARLDPSHGLTGNTTVVLLDENVVLDLDPKNKERYRIEKVGMPLDVQPLDGDRVLLAEYNANRVTERDGKGTVVWEHKLSSPLVAQRLPNGHTFMANADAVFEIDAKGKEVFRHTPIGGQRVMRARRLPAGDVLMVTQLGGTQFTRLDRFGRQSARFGVQVSTSGGRLDLDADGNVLITEMDNNAVVAYDRKGNVVRSVPFDGPVAVTALPNGNTITTAYRANRAVEIDPSGKEVWEFKHTTRVTRAVRH